MLTWQDLLRQTSKIFLVHSCTIFFFSLVHYLMLSGRICQDSSELYARLFWPTCVFLCWRIRSFCENFFFVCPGVFFDVDVVGCVATNSEVWARFFLLAHVHFFDADVARSVVINSELCVRFFLGNLHFLCWHGICHDNSEVCKRFFFVHLHFFIVTWLDLSPQTSKFVRVFFLHTCYNSLLTWRIISRHEHSSQDFCWCVLATTSSGLATTCFFYT